MTTEPDPVVPAASPDLDARGPIHFEISAGLAWSLLGWLQLARRHPQARESACARDVESFARELARRIAPDGTPLAELVARGWDPNHDVQRPAESEAEAESGLGMRIHGDSPVGFPPGVIGWVEFECKLLFPPNQPGFREAFGEGAKTIVLALFDRHLGEALAAHAQSCMARPASIEAAAEDRP